jgi:hypothetical protein
MPLWRAAKARRDGMRARVEEQSRGGRVGSGQQSGEVDGKGQEEDNEDGSDEESEAKEQLALGRRMGTRSFTMDSWRGDADLLNK